MKKDILIGLILFIVSLTVSAKSGYYITSTTITSGARLIEGDAIENANLCVVVEKKELKKYTPYDVSEYGFSNGDIYESFDISLDTIHRRFFLKKITTGKINLYKLCLKGYDDTYYTIIGDSKTLVKVPGNTKDLRDLLNQIIDDSPASKSNIPLVKYQQQSMERFFNDYNKGLDRPYPTLHVGCKLNLNATTHFPANKIDFYSVPTLQTMESLSAGLFMDIPLFYSNFSISPELNFIKSQSSQSIDDQFYSYDLFVNYSSIDIPLLLRYSFYHNGLTPYIQAGPVYSRIVKNNSELYCYKSEGNNVFMNRYAPIISNQRSGYSIGCGFVSCYRARFSLFGELRYQQLFTTSKSDYQQNSSNYSVSLGLVY